MSCNKTFSYSVSQQTRSHISPSEEKPYFYSFIRNSVPHAHSSVLSDTGLIDKKTMANGNDKTGPALLELVVQPFVNIYCESQEGEKILNEKCASYPRPANAGMLKVPGLNSWLEEITTKECKAHDRDLQNVQHYMIASMSAIAGQAQTLLQLEQWAMTSIHSGIASKTHTFAKCFATLMDANLLMTRAMYQTNQFRRVLIKEGMADSLMELLLDDNKPSPDWIAGEDANTDMTGVKKQTVTISEVNEIQTKYRPDNSAQLKSYVNNDPGEGVKMLSSSQENDIKEDLKLIGSLEFNMQLNDSEIQSKPLNCLTLSEPQPDDLRAPFNSRESKALATCTAGEKYLMPDHLFKIEQDNSDSDGVEDTTQDSITEDNIVIDAGEVRSVDFSQPAAITVQSKTHTDEKLVCNHCGNGFTTINRLKTHMRIHTAKPPHSCDDCGKSFNQNSKLKRHMKTHTGAKLDLKNESGQNTVLAGGPKHMKLSKKKCYQCTDCGKTFNQSGNLGLHRRVHTGEKPHLCSECGRAFRNSGTLKTHMRLHTGEKPFLCSDCGTRFTSVGGLNAHIRTHNHMGGLDDSKKEKLRKSFPSKNHICNDCGKAFFKNCHLKRHTLTHTGEKPHACSVCNKRFAAKSDVKEHMMIHTGLKPYPCSECGNAFRSVSKRRVHMQMHITKPHMCSVCGKGFTTMESLLKHNETQQCNAKVSMNTNTGEKPYVCSECGKRFRIWRNLKAHLTIHGGKKSHLCSECGKSFLKKQTLQIHMWTHTAERPYLCKVCGRGFIQPTILKAHMRTHTGETMPHLCSECGKGFIDSSSLKSHMRVHTGGEPHICSDCGKVLINATSLSTHMKIHTEPKAFGCSKCDKAFTYKGNLKTHMRSHTGEKPYICPECGQKFSVASNLNKHLKTHNRVKCQTCSKEFNQMSKLKVHMACHTG